MFPIFCWVINFSHFSLISIRKPITCRLYRSVCALTCIFRTIFGSSIYKGGGRCFENLASPPSTVSTKPTTSATNHTSDTHLKFLRTNYPNYRRHQTANTTKTHNSQAQLDRLKVQPTYKGGLVTTESRHHQTIQTHTTTVETFINKKC